MMCGIGVFRIYRVERSLKYIQIKFKDMNEYIYTLVCKHTPP